jgi:DNA-binding IclR family transcriptional regulator
LGKATLAAKADDEIALLLAPTPYKQLTRKTKRSFAAIVKDIKESRRLGYAIFDEENIENVFAVGAPIRNACGPTIAALSGAVLGRG